MPLNTRQNPQNLADILFTLCVNFLMYVVLILVFYMLLRFYLEEEYELSDDEGGPTSPRAVRQVNTKSVDGTQSDAVTNMTAAGTGEGTMELEMKPLGADFDGLGASVKEFSKMDMRTSVSSSSSSAAARARGTSTKLRTDSETSEDDFATETESRVETGTGYAASLGAILNSTIPSETGTRQEVIQRALFCAIGLNITFCLWGVIQERILTVAYDGEFFEYSYGLVFMNRIGGFIMSAALVYYYKVVFISSPVWEYSMPSVANMLSSWCQYEALRYVSFPTAMLAKAFKMVPTMLMGKFMHDKTYETYEYVSAAFVGFGLYLFLSSSENIDFKENVFGDPENVTGAWCGVVLLVLFLAFDSFTGQWQHRMFTKHKHMSPLQMMLMMNGFSSVFSFITLIHQDELSVSLRFAYDHPSFFGHLMLFTITANIGLIFINYTVKNFGPVVLSIIMSIRILMSTLLSCFVYDHPITELGVVGIIVVFAAVAYNTERKRAGGPLIKWAQTKKMTKAHQRVARSFMREHWDDA